MNNNLNNNAAALLDAAHRAWLDAADFRKKRQRNKNFTYGNQWDDLVRNEDGVLITEKQALADAGREPLGNNMIRQMVKSVVGRYRFLARESQPANEGVRLLLEQNEAAEIDSRAMEEFLISGCCIQKVGMVRRLNSNVIDISNVNPNKFFVNAISDPRGNDIKLIGEIHDMAPAEMIMLLSQGSRSKAKWIRDLYDSKRLDVFDGKLVSGGDVSFFVASHNLCRIYEIWSLEIMECVQWVDGASGNKKVLSVDAFNAIPKKQRNAINRQTLQWGVRQVWRCRWITPMGDVVAEYDSPYSHNTHPYILKLYPLTDGEIHSFVEDVIDQQKYINRLITAAHHVISSSAKGVLLYPTDALPAGYTWEKLKQMWRSPDGIIPYESADKMPQQIFGSGLNQGAFQLLDLEMKLFDTISGVSAAFRGSEVANNKGAELYNRQTDNSIIALGDIFESFNAFINARNLKLATI